jgi:hypothetical protein
MEGHVDGSAGNAPVVVTATFVVFFFLMSRTNTSSVPTESPLAKLLEYDSNTTYRPLAEIAPNQTRLWRPGSSCP